ncbi:MAG: hypothetical protein JO291_09230 [Acidimicrobiia bacterium]|nr:hypothetical protein [Acidimicrobiia bacterium]
MSKRTRQIVCVVVLAAVGVVIVALWGWGSAFGGYLGGLIAVALMRLVLSGPTAEQRQR